MKCIILAGGSGERLWPISRDLYPKSLLNLYGKKTLIQNTFELAAKLTKENNIITITNIRQFSDIMLQIKELYKSPVIISEPMSKNTAPAVASAITFLEGKRDEIVLILPVDFKISNENIFKSQIEQAKAIAKKGYIVTFGIKPESNECGYGYIQTDSIEKDYKTVKYFIEKPQKEELKKYINKGNTYINSGIYLAKISVLKEAYEKYAKNINSDFTKEMFDENKKIKYEYYENIPEISIDYAIMEKADNLVMQELKTEWKDYGSWQSVYNNTEKDKDDNVIQGNVITNGTKNSFIYSSKELTAALGIKNTIVIETEDAVLVCNKNRASDINKLVEELKKNNNETTKIRKTVFRPWGYYTCLNKGNGWLTKIITVSPGHKLSLQSHNYRSEHWVILEGCATILLDGNEYTLNKRQSINIPVKSKHSLQNRSNEILKILEVQKGTYISEDDIIRYEDIYGRIE